MHVYIGALWNFPVIFATGGDDQRLTRKMICYYYLLCASGFYLAYMYGTFDSFVNYCMLKSFR